VNLYAYVREDPTNRTDPTGDDAIVIVQANGDVQVIIPVTFSGDAATPKNIAQFEGAVSSASQSVDGHQVTFTAVQGTSPIDSSVTNTVALANGPTSPAPSGEGNSGHSYVWAGTQGHVTMQDVKGRGIVAPDGQTESTALKTGTVPQRVTSWGPEMVRPSLLRKLTRSKHGADKAIPSSIQL
jgi:hypothetical protein